MRWALCRPGEFASVHSGLRYQLLPPEAILWGNLGFAGLAKSRRYLRQATAAATLFVASDFV